MNVLVHVTVNVPEKETFIGPESSCLQGLVPCFPSYASTNDDSSFGYVYVHEHVPHQKLPTDAVDEPILPLQRIRAAT
jgi:hypothetical protein